MTTDEVAQRIRRTPEQAALFGSRIGNGWRTMMLSIGYVALYLAFDRLSFIGALHGIGITPWSPTAGLAMVLLIIKGLRYSPLILAGELFSGGMLPTVSPPLMPIFLGSVVVTAGYMSVVTVLRHLRFEADLRRSSDTVLLLIATIIGSGLVASGFVGSYAVSGVVPWSAFAEAGFHYWIGDAIGIVVLLPPLLLLYRRIKQRAPPVQGWGSFDLGEIAVQAASIVLALAVMFSGVGGDRPLGLFYLLFPPLIWIATRHGLPAASWAAGDPDKLDCWARGSGSYGAYPSGFSALHVRIGGDGAYARCGRQRASPSICCPGRQRRPAHRDPEHGAGRCPYD